MTTQRAPATAAGRALAAGPANKHYASWAEWAIAIEAEARQQERERIRAAVNEIAPPLPAWTLWVLAILDGDGGAPAEQAPEAQRTLADDEDAMREWAKGQP